MSESIDALRVELARVRRPTRFWASVVVTLSVAFLAEVGLVVAQNMTLHRPQLIIRSSRPIAIAPTLAPVPTPIPTPAPKPIPTAAPKPTAPSPPPRKRHIDVTAPVCPENDPFCGLND